MPSHEPQPYLPSTVGPQGIPALPLGAAFTPPPPIPPAEESEGLNVSRILDAIVRFRWVVLAVSLVVAAAGFGLTRFITPTYDVQSTIWISMETDEARAAGPIRADELFAGSAWPDLLRSFAILDTVVRETRLYVTPAVIADSLVFAAFEVAPKFQPGQYRLTVDEAGRSLTLADVKGNTLETVAPGDSLGRALGLRWAPSPRVLRPGQIVDFSVVTPREASLRLRQRLGVSLPPETNLMRVTLTGTEPVRLAQTLNTLTSRFVEAAAGLKKRNLVEFRRTLEVQLAYAEGELREAESALENFRIINVTEPSDRGPAIPGIQETRDPVLDAYFRDRGAFDQLRRDRVTLERTLAAVRAGTAEPSAFWAVSALALPHESPELRAAITDLSVKEAALRDARVTYTDQHPIVQERLRAVRELRTEAIPQIASALLTRWQLREREMKARLDTTAVRLRQIPTRTIEEGRLERNVETRQNLYTTLKNRFEEARLAEVSTVPDVTVLDPAVAPTTPSSNTAPKIILMAIVGGFGLACAIALLLDRLDRRLHYPDQVTKDLRLSIVGAVPKAGSRRRGKSMEQAAAFVEAFRAIRVNLQYSLLKGAPMRLAVSSPGQGDGKSFVSANLALSFAEAGYRTVLVDGDTRRGALHDTFGTDRRPGLVDYLGAGVPLEQVMRPTTQERLTLVPCGTRAERSPELLASSRLVELLAEFDQRFDVVIIDTPPLGAGVDAFVLGIAARHLVMVLRSGRTDRKLAHAKLELLDRLPVAVLGAVLNDVPTMGDYRYYSYLPGYNAEEEQELVALR